jgi:hypothetical protein
MSTDEVVEKLHIENELSVGCNIGPKSVNLIWALYLDLLVIGLIGD